MILLSAAALRPCRAQQLLHWQPLPHEEARGIQDARGELLHLIGCSGVSSCVLASSAQMTGRAVQSAC